MDDDDEWEGWAIGFLSDTPPGTVVVAPDGTLVCFVGEVDDEGGQEDG